MNKIMVIGRPGSGKSVFSRKLHNLTKIPLYHLDMLNWNADKTYVEKSVLIERINNVLIKESWIIDGNYNSCLEMRFEKCDTVFFLDYPLEVCLSGIKERVGKKRDDMPWIETEVDEEFLSFVKNFDNDSKPKILKLLEKHSDKKIYVFKRRQEAEEYLKTLY